MVTLWGRQWSRAELLARIGRLEQVAGVRLTVHAEATRHLPRATGSPWNPIAIC